MKTSVLALTIAAGLLTPTASQAGICHVTRDTYNVEIYALCSPDITESEAEDFADDACERDACEVWMWTVAKYVPKGKKLTPDQRANARFVRFRTGIFTEANPQSFFEGK